jgi:hypothetical protein
VRLLTSARRRLGLLVDVVFIRRRSFSFGGGFLCSWAAVFVRGQLFLFVGGRFCS